MRMGGLGVSACVVESLGGCVLQCVYGVFVVVSVGLGLGRVCGYVYG